MEIPNIMVIESVPTYGGSRKLHTLS